MGQFLIFQRHIRLRNCAVSICKIKILTDGVLRSRRKSISELISIVENDSVAAREAIGILYPHTGHAAIVGMTGVQGVGKSTLVSALAKEIRKGGETVGVIAVDPTSTYSGGAFLGDRIRMRELANDDGVFIRSMATRGHPGGLARATADVVQILDASHMDYVLVETVGAGQMDVEIRETAETVVVMTAPDLGDEIQFLKAGLTEIGDIFVVNKADRSGSDRTATEIEETLRMREDWGQWRPVVVKTIATHGIGTKELVKIVREHQKLVKQDGNKGVRESLAKAQLKNAIRNTLECQVFPDWMVNSEFEELVKEMLSRRLDPYSAAQMFLSKRLQRSI